MGIKEFIQNKAWSDYSVHNPFMTKEQVKTAREYAKGGWYNDSKKYSEFHPQDDALIVELKAMLSPPKPEPLLSRMLYAYERFIRKHTDVAAKALAGRSESEKAGAKRCDEIDKKNVKNWDEIQAANEKRYAEWRIKEKARKLSERVFLFKPERPRMRH